MLEGTPAEKATDVLTEARRRADCDTPDLHDAFDCRLGAEPWYEYGDLYQATYGLATMHHPMRPGGSEQQLAENKQLAANLWADVRPYLRAYWENCRTARYTGWHRESTGPVRKSTPRRDPISVEQATVLEELETAQQRVNRHAEELTQRDDAIRAALAADLSVMDMVNRTGLSRERVYQIRDGRR